MFNIYDQANKVTYPDYKSGYWQRQVPLTELAARDIYTRFTQNFGSALDSINTWGVGDRMAGLLLDGDSLYLLRIHNGGNDGSGRPQRWTLFLWREQNFSSASASASGSGGGVGSGDGNGGGGVCGGVRGVVDVARWLGDAAWPAPRDNAPVPLPPVVPDVVYDVPLLSDEEARENAVDGAVGAGGGVGGAAFGDVLAEGEVEYFPAQLEAGPVAQIPANLAEVQRLWAAWTLSERREKTGALLFSAVGCGEWHGRLARDVGGGVGGGAGDRVGGIGGGVGVGGGGGGGFGDRVGGGFKCVHDLRIGRSVVLERREEAERRRQAEVNRRAEEARREAEDARRRADAKRLREAEEAECRRREESRRVLRLALNLAFAAIIAGAILAVVAHVVWVRFFHGGLM